MLQLAMASETRPPPRKWVQSKFHDLRNSGFSPDTKNSRHPIDIAYTATETAPAWRSDGPNSDVKRNKDIEAAIRSGNFQIHQVLLVENAIERN
jgi:hypothetical protein